MFYLVSGEQLAQWRSTLSTKGWAISSDDADKIAEEISNILEGK